MIIIGGTFELSDAYKFLKVYLNKKVVIVAKESEIGLPQKGHNSVAIQSGLYYIPCYLKGNELSYWQCSLQRVL